MRIAEESLHYSMSAARQGRASRNRSSGQHSTASLHRAYPSRCKVTLAVTRAPAGAGKNESEHGRLTTAWDGQATTQVTPKDEQLTLAKLPRYKLK